MAFTYVVSTNRGKVRLLIGDTDSNNVLLQDDEIDFFLSESNDNVYLAASYAARSISGKFSREADTTVESVSKSYSQRSRQYSQLAAQLEAQSKRVRGSIPTPAISGISKDAINTQREDEDRVQGKFYMDKFSNPQNDKEDDYNGYC